MAQRNLQFLYIDRVFIAVFRISTPGGNWHIPYQQNPYTINQFLLNKCSIAIVCSLKPAMKSSLKPTLASWMSRHLASQNAANQCLAKEVGVFLRGGRDVPKLKTSMGDPQNKSSTCRPVSFSLLDMFFSV